MNTPRVANLLMLACLTVASVAVYGGLPERIPLHFDLSGTPDSWARKSIASWFLIPGFAVITTAFMYWLGGMAHRHPKFVNVPDKDRFLALPPERRLAVIEVMRRFMEWVAFVTTVMFVLIQIAIYRSASGKDASVLLISTFMVAPVILILASIYVTKATELYRPASRPQR